MVRRADSRNEARALRVVLLGYPGAGKGAQGEILARREGLAHLSTGVLLRREIEARSDIGRRLADHLGRGGFADDRTVLELVESAFAAPECAAGFVLDGFPRTVPQARALDRLLAERGLSIDCAIDLRVRQETVIRRLSGRLCCPACTVSYHVEFRPPRSSGVCDRCGVLLYQRPEDRPEVHSARLSTYRELTAPVVEHYRARGVLAEVDGEAPVALVDGRVRDSIAKAVRCARSAEAPRNLVPESAWIEPIPVGARRSGPPRSAAV